MKMSRELIRACKTKMAFAVGITAVAVLAVAAMAAAPKASAPPYLPLNVHVGEKAPDFALPSASGGVVKLSQFAGRNVLLDFYEGYW